MAKEHKWDESKSGIKKHYRKILYPTLGVALAGTTTAAIALPLMVKKIAEEKTKGILEKMIPLGGPENSLRNKEKINYMAIGDSITAGYNGYMDTAATINTGHDANYVSGDYLSYADFIANDLNKANKLGDYRNFALTGDRIPNTREKIFRDTTALKALQNANLISISLGANDLLAAVEVLKVSFNALRGASVADKIVQFNEARENFTKMTGIGTRPISEINSEARGVSGRHRISSPSGYASDEDIQNLIAESFDKMDAMFKEGTLAGLIDIEQELLDAIFQLIQLDMATLIAEVHAASPDAKIVVMGYAFPFHLLPDSLINNTIYDLDDNGNRAPRMINGKPANLKMVYGEFINTLKTLCDRANYVKFFNINDLKEFSDQSDIVDWKLIGEAANHSGDISKHEPEWDRVMPNPLDIHPSTYGHQVIAGHLYEWMAKDMGLTIPAFESIQKIPSKTEEIASLHQYYTYAGDQGFEIKDERAADQSSIVPIIRALDAPEILKSVGYLLDKYVNKEGLAQNYKSLLELVSKLNDSNVSLKDKAMQIFDALGKVLNLDAPFGNVQDYKISDFLGQLMLTVGSVNWDKVDFTQSDMQAIIVDLIDTKKGDGVALFELLFAASIYLGDRGEAFGTKLKAHTQLNTDDKISDAINKVLDVIRGVSYRDYIKSINLGGNTGVSSNALGNMLSSYPSFSIDAVIGSGADAHPQWVLANTNAQGGRTPWFDTTTSQTHFKELLDEVIQKGKDFGMDISSLFTDMSNDDKETFMQEFIIGTADGKIGFTEMIKNMGIDVSTQKFWAKSGSSSLVELAKTHHIDLTASFESIYHDIVALT